MRIGIFTDTYHPSTNGVVAVVDILRRNFEAAGHEVFVFAPAGGLKTDASDPHIIHFPAVKGLLYDDLNAALLFPPSALRQIKACQLDVVHFLTVGPVGLLGVYAAHQLRKPLVAEYCTDFFQYIEHYPQAIAALIALAMLLPFSIRGSASDLLDILKVSRPRLGLNNWNRALIKDLTTILHTHCDAVIVHSRRSAEQLKAWQSHDYHYPMALIPTGVDALPTPTKNEVNEFCKTHGITASDDIIMYVGRISAEKNLDILVAAMPELVALHPAAKLVFVGDFDYRPTLEAKAKASSAAERIVFTGRMPRQKLGTALATAKVFAFPSLTDTQGLVVHEAAMAGLPLVLVDKKVSEVLKPGQNGAYAKNDPTDIARVIAAILQNEQTRQVMGQASVRIAGAFSERAQADKILKLYARILKKAATT